MRPPPPWPHTSISSPRAAPRLMAGRTTPTPTPSPVTDASAGLRLPGLPRPPSEADLRQPPPSAASPVHRRSRSTPRRHAQALQARRPVPVQRGSFFTHDNVLLTQRHDAFSSPSPSRAPSATASSRRTGGHDACDNLSQAGTETDDIVSALSGHTGAASEHARPSVGESPGLAAAVHTNFGHPSTALASNVLWPSRENVRLEENYRKERYWQRWGPYLSERQWVRACPAPNWRSDD